MIEGIRKKQNTKQKYTIHIYNSLIKTTKQMKQKLFTLLTLLVLCVTGAWGDPASSDAREDEYEW